MLIHGFLSSSAIFAPLRDVLAQTHTVITVDLPGFGHSASVPVPGSVERVAEMVFESIDRYVDDNSALVGHSLGAMLGLQIALDHPHQVRNVVSYGGCGAGHVPTRFETYENSIKRIEATGIEAVAASIAAKWFCLGDRHPLYELAKAAGAGSDQLGAIRYLQVMADWDVRHRLGDLAARTLVICGDRDRATHPDLSLELWRNIPNAQLCILPGCGHITHLERADLFNAVLGQFLAVAERGGCLSRKEAVDPLHQRATR